MNEPNENDETPKELGVGYINRSKSSSVNHYRTGNHGFKSLPLHNFSLHTKI
jgi:hypothetical protein